MDKPKRSDRLKSESSGDEEDFESADEGEEGQENSRPPSLATSADGGKNSTSKSQVTKGKTKEKTHEMAAQEPSSPLPSGKSEEIEKSQGDSSNTKESCSTVDQEVQNSSSKSADLEGDHSHSDLQEHKPEGKEDAKPSGDGTIAQDVSDDEEIQFKIDSKKPSEDSSELEKTQTDETLEAHKETTHQQVDNEEVQNKVQEEKASSIEKEDDGNLEEKSKENVPDESQTNAEDSGKVDKSSSEKSADAVGESAKPKPQEGAEPHCEDVWGWGSWGTMLSSVSSGLSSVIEKVETSLGIPEPEVMAQKVTEDEKQAKEIKQTETIIETEPTAESPPKGPPPESSQTAEDEKEDSSYFAGFGVRGLTDAVHEGLEALEYIGKKTMNVISEGDPGLRGKREVLMPKEPTLSQILREAKEEAEYKASHPDHKESIVNFSTEFDKFQGLAHLEALEILSKESLSKVEAHFIDLSSEDLKSVKPLLRTIQEVVKFTEDEEENDDDEEQEFESEVSVCLKDLNLTHIPNKSSDVDKRAKEWIDACINEQNDDPLSRDHVEIFTAGISALAELTATTIEQFHKIAEVLLLLAENKDTSALVRAQSLKKLTMCVCREVSGLSSRFAGCLSTVSKESQDSEAIESLITNLYLESSDSSRYLQHALKLLCPVLQHSSLTENTSAGKS